VNYFSPQSYIQATTTIEHEISEIVSQGKKDGQKAKARPGNPKHFERHLFLYPSFLASSSALHLFSCTPTQPTRVVADR
jgi:hypothetical protein